MKFRNNPQDNPFAVMKKKIKKHAKAGRTDSVRLEASENWESARVVLKNRKDGWRQGNIELVAAAVAVIYDCLGSSYAEVPQQITALAAAVKDRSLSPQQEVARQKIGALCDDADVVILEIGKAVASKGC